MKINLKALEPTLREHPKSKNKYNLVPFPNSEELAWIDPLTGEMKTGMTGWNKYNNCVKGWELTVKGEDDKPLEFNDENKKFMYNYHPDTGWVILQIDLLQHTVFEEVKN